MTCLTAASRSEAAPARMSRSAPSAMTEKHSVAPAAVRANPSRSSDANQIFAVDSGAPTWAKRRPIGVRSDNVSLTSKTTTTGVLIGCLLPSSVYAPSHEAMAAPI